MKPDVAMSVYQASEVIHDAIRAASASCEARGVEGLVVVVGLATPNGIGAQIGVRTSSAETSSAEDLKAGVIAALRKYVGELPGVVVNDAVQGGGAS